MNIKLYINKIRQSLIVALSHRMTSVVIMTFGFIFILIEFIVGYIYYQGNDVLLGLSKERYFFFISYFNLVSYTYQFFFTLAHEELSEKIIEGELDYVFIRPVNSYFYYALSGVDFPSLSGIILSLSTFIVFYPNEFIFRDGVFILIMLMFSVAFVFLLNQILITLIFWLEKSTRITEVPEYLMDFSSRPRSFFPKAIQIIFTTIIPSFTATNIVLDYLDGTLHYREFLWFVVYVFVMFAVSYLLWKKGMRKYQSAN